MKLLAIRDINEQDPLPTLGPKVAPPAPPEPPALRPTATPGIMQRPDGKLETDLPMPSDPEATSLQDHWADACKKAKADFDARKERIVSSPFFSNTDKSSWWVREQKADDAEVLENETQEAKRLMHASNYGARPEDFRKMWEADFADIERRVVAQPFQTTLEEVAAWVKGRCGKKSSP